MPQIRQADPAEYESLLRFLAEAYGVSIDFFPGRFPSWWGEYTDFSRIWVMARGDRIESLVRIFPLELVLGEVTVPVGGIGSVGTRPDARGQGHMQHLMYRAIEAMKEEFCLSVLWGDRHRYRLFGYEQAGSSLRMEISLRGLGKMGIKPLAGVARYFGEEELLDQIRRCHDREPFRRVRRNEEHALLYGRAGLIVLTSGVGDHFGYLVFSSDRNESAVLEFGGHPLTVLGLSAGLLGGGRRVALHLSFPVRAAAAPAYWAAASAWSIEPAALVTILHLSDAIKVFRPLLQENPGAADPALLHLGQAEAVERLFGVGRPGAAPFHCGALDRV